MKKKTQANAGVTLFEITVAVAIAVAVTAIAVPITMKMIRKSYEDETRNELTSIAEAIEIYVQDVGDFPPDLDALLEAPVGAPATWNGPYAWAGLNSDGFTMEFVDGWGTPYTMYELEEFPNRRFVRSAGPDRVDDNGGNDDIAVQVDVSPWRRTETRRELAVLNLAIGQYNLAHLPHEPLPSDINELVETLVEKDYLDDGDGYLTDAWGEPYIPGPEPVQEIYLGGNSLGGGWPSGDDDDDDDGGEGDGMPGDDDDDDDGGEGAGDDDDDDDGGEGTGDDDDDDGGDEGAGDDDDDDDNGNGNSKKVTLCHIPPGNPDAAHTINVGANAVPAHLAHGDTLGPCCPISIDFEHEDDGSTILIDGQDVSTPPEFGNMVSISGSGPNYGPAIFDSSIDGPNDPGRDSDLLVDIGNLLILQENNTQSVEGIFDYPDDDAGGGYLIFEFTTYVEAATITLVDVDDGTVGQAVHLINANGEERYYECPGGWTTDIAEQGGTGYGVLDLTTLDNQPGYETDAWCTETDGFDPEKVVRIEVCFSGSGAVGGFSVCPKGDIEEEGACLSSVWAADSSVWAETGFDPSDLLSDVFDIRSNLLSCSPGLDTATLAEALEFSGWGGKCGKARKLSVQAVTALLNAAHPDIEFSMSVEEVIAFADTAYDTNNGGQMNNAASDLEDLNTASGCPLD